MFLATVTMASIHPASIFPLDTVFWGMTWLAVSAFLPVIADRHVLQAKGRNEEMREMGLQLVTRSWFVVGIDGRRCQSDYLIFLNN